jgi:type I restriction enzyme S subunit
MLFTYVGTIGNVALINEDDKYYLAPNVSRIRFDCNVIIPRFALYVFMSEYFHRTQINKFLNSSSMKNLSMENIRKFKLPIPPLSEQQRIVSILDTFEASINNLEQQLAQREKQYEYYRNKLLTFEKEKN